LLRDKKREGEKGHRIKLRDKKREEEKGHRNKAKR